jgi:gliding motility-associated-like protein
VTDFSWTPTTALSDPAIAHPLASPLRTTTYTLQVTTGAGCTAEGTVKIAVYSLLAIPQAFTPNGDGHNDIFYVLGGPIGSLVKDFAVYDRWGEPVFQVHDVAPDDPAFGWKGLAGGRPAEAGTYVYFVRMAFANGTQQVYKGTVVLVR